MKIRHQKSDLMRLRSDCESLEYETLQRYTQSMGLAHARHHRNRSLSPKIIEYSELVLEYSILSSILGIGVARSDGFVDLTGFIWLGESERGINSPVSGVLKYWGSNLEKSLCESESTSSELTPTSNPPQDLKTLRSPSFLVHPQPLVPTLDEGVRTVTPSPRKS